MDVRDFDFELPPELIAQEPPAVRGSSRLLHLDRRTGVRTQSTIEQLPTYLDAGDVVVLNNTKVFPARLLGRRSPSGGAVECLLVKRLSAAEGPEEVWEALMHPGQKLAPGARVVFESAGAERLHGEVLARHFHGRRSIRLWTASDPSVRDVVDAIGHVPLPPYIRRPDISDDQNRY